MGGGKQESAGTEGKGDFPGAGDGRDVFMAAAHTWSRTVWTPPGKTCFKKQLKAPKTQSTRISECIVYCAPLKGAL